MGTALERATATAGLEKQEVARRAGVDPNTVTNWFKGRTLKADQMACVAGLLRENPESRRIVLAALGVEEPGGTEIDASLLEVLERARRHRDNPFVRSALRNLEDVVYAASEERPALRVADDPGGGYAGGAENAPATGAAK